MQRLGEAARRVLEVVAVAGRPVGQEEACLAAGVGAGGPSALAALRAGRLIRGTGPDRMDEVEAYHDRIRETVAARLAPAVSWEHHRRLAEALEASEQGGPEVLAGHWLSAGEAARAGVYYALAAAQAADALAFDHAAQLYRLAIELSEATAAQAGQLRRARGDALANAGRGAEAAREYLAAAVAAPEGERTDLERRAAAQYFVAGYVDEGVAVLRGVLAQMGLPFPGTPRRALWGLIWKRAKLRLRGLNFRRRDPEEVPTEDLGRIDVCWATAGALGNIDVIRGAYFHARGLLLALRAGDAVRVSRFLAWEAIQNAVVGWSVRQRTAELLRRAEAVAGERENPGSRGLVLLAKGVAAFLEGRWRDVRGPLAEAERIFRGQCVGLVWEANATQVYSLASLSFLGDFAQLRERLPAVLGEARARGSLYLVANLNTLISCLIRLAADEPDEAERELSEVMSEWPPHGYHLYHHIALMAQVMIDLYREQGSSALDRLAKQWGAHARSQLLRVQRVRVDLLQLRAGSALAVAGRAADPRPFVRAAERDARRLEREGGPWAVALAQLRLAGVAFLRGDRPRAVELLGRAASDLDTAEIRLHAAAARRRLGELLGDAEGQALVEQADAWMAGQGVRNPSRMTALYVPGFPNR